MRRLTVVTMMGPTGSGERTRSGRHRQQRATTGAALGKAEWTGNGVPCDGFWFVFFPGLRRVAR